MINKNDLKSAIFLIKFLDIDFKKNKMEFTSANIIYRPLCI